MLGGTVSAAQLGPLASALAAANEETAPRYLGAAQFELLERIVDLVIPESDTPGALAAGIHRFIDMMLADWASADSRARYTDALQRIDNRAMDLTGAAFVALSVEQQFAVLQDADRAAYTDGADDSTFRDLKKLILFGYYSSEQGGSVELKYDRLPGGYPGCVSLSEIGRSWSS